MEPVPPIPNTQYPICGLVPMRWSTDRLLMLDQRVLPTREVWLELTTYRDVVEAIKAMAVRGAPAIGVAAGYGMAITWQLYVASRWTKRHRS